jgi:rod shape-determining protein MreB
MSGSSIAVDIGTANTRLFTFGAETLIEEPTIGLLEGRTLFATGSSARAVQERLSAANLRARNWSIVQPVTGGVVKDVAMAAAFVRSLYGVAGRRFTRLADRLLITRPVGVTPLERQALYDLGKALGAADAGLVPTLVAAAFGAGISMESARPVLVVDLGEGKSEAGVVSLGGLISSASTDASGGTMNSLIIEHLRARYGLLVDHSEAALLKHTIGSAFAQPGETMVIRGRSVDSGEAVKANVTSPEIHALLARPLRQITDMVRSALAEVPPDICADLYSTGILMTGGGAGLRGMGRYLTSELGLPVHVAANPAHCAVFGLAHLLKTERMRSKRPMSKRSMGKSAA